MIILPLNPLKGLSTTTNNYCKEWKLLIIGHHYGTPCTKTARVRKARTLPTASGSHSRRNNKRRSVKPSCEKWQQAILSGTIPYAPSKRISATHKHSHPSSSPALSRKRIGRMGSPWCKSSMVESTSSVPSRRNRSFTSTSSNPGPRKKTKNISLIASDGIRHLKINYYEKDH